MNLCHIYNDFDYLLALNVFTFSLLHSRILKSTTSRWMNTRKGPHLRQVWSFLFSQGFSSNDFPLLSDHRSGVFPILMSLFLRPCTEDAVFFYLQAERHMIKFNTRHYDPSQQLNRKMAAFPNGCGHFPIYVTLRK